jgi:putative endopeptidase
MKKTTIACLVVASFMGLTETFAQSAYSLLPGMDPGAKPGTDFYRYATGGWSDANPIPAEYARYGSFDKLRENNLKQLQDLVADLQQTKAPQGSNAQKIADLYRLGMDSVRLNNEGASPIRHQLLQIQKAGTRQELMQLVATLHVQGMSPFFECMVGPDEKNSSRYLLQFAQGGLGLGDREYYLATDSVSVALRKGYARLIRTNFILAGYTQQQAETAARNVLQLETRLAKAHYPKEKVRNPEENYHKIGTTQLSDSIGPWNWNGLFAVLGAKNVTAVNVSQPEALQEVVRCVLQQPISVLRHYLAWNLINEAAPYLSDAFIASDFEFFGKQLSGAQENRPRWKRTLSVVDGNLGEALGQLYVARYFPPQAKERMLTLVRNLQQALGERIDALTWMGSQTKERAQEKRNRFIVKIGYPDVWRDFSGLVIDPTQSYWENNCKASAFETAFQMGKLDKEVDRSEWLMTPQTVNAYYNPTTNEICFPAGILQPPFFYIDADDAVNYGAIGVVIGHEMTHGFDDQGAKYDTNGNMFDWWSPDDATRFVERTKVLVDHFNQIKVLGDVHANGAFTLGENIADNGGLQVSLQAFGKTQQAREKIPVEGFTPLQRFFLSYARVWAGNIRDAEVLRLTKLDPHSLAKWRVNGTLPHIDAWYEAFGIGSETPLYVPKEKRVSIW